MPMACSVSCAIFERFSSMLEWVTVRETGLHHTVHYVDDFLFAGRQGTGNCEYMLQAFWNLAKCLRVPLTMDKTEDPAHTLTYLGTELNRVWGISRLPAEKLKLVRALRWALKGAKKITQRELQIVMGQLNFICLVVAPVQAFCAQLASASSGV